MPKKEKSTERSCSTRSRPLRQPLPPRGSPSPWKPAPAWAPTAFFQTRCQKNTSPECERLIWPKMCKYFLFFYFVIPTERMDSRLSGVRFRIRVTASVNHITDFTLFKKRHFFCFKMCLNTFRAMKTGRKEEEEGCKLLTSTGFVNFKCVCNSHIWLYIKP